METTSQLVKIIAIHESDVLEGMVKIRVNSGNEYLVDYYGKHFIPNEISRISILPVDGYAIDWESTFNKNPDNKKELIPVKDGTEYDGYGQIISINPIIADFGDFLIEIGEWSNDERIIGSYIYWFIDRLIATT